MAISSIPCPYTALGLDSNASPAAIRSAYKKLMLQCHPDKVHDESQAEEKAAQYERVREAYELLSDPKRKRKYDSEMKREAACDKEPSSRSSSAHVEIPVPESRESSAEGKPREKTRDRTPRRDESRSSKRAPEPEVEEYVVEEAEPEVEEPLPKERKERESSNSRSSREREPVFEVEVEEIDETTEPATPHSHSRCSSQEKKSRTESTSSQSPPSMEAKEELLRKYEEQRKKEEALLKAARQKMMGFEAEPPSTAPLGGHRNGSSERSHDRAAKAERSRIRREREQAAAAAAAASGMDPAAYLEAVRLEKEKRHYARQTTAGVDLSDDFDQSTIHPMDDIPQPSPKMSESRRGSKQRDNSPKDTPPTSRERKSSQSGSERKESVSPVRESTHQTQRPIPIRNPYGSNAPPPAASSAFGSSFSSSTSPRRRHSVSNSADPTKARLHREDSGYSSPNYSGTPMGPNEPKMPPSFHRSATEGFGKKVVEVDQDEEAAVQEFLEQRRRQKKAESSHPLDGDMPSTAPLRPKEHRKKSSGSAPIPSPSNAVPVSPYYAAYGYYPTAAGTPMGYVPAPGSSHPHGSSRRHNSHSSHHSGQSPHASPKIPADGFAGMRSPSFSGAHPGAEFYAGYDPAYYAHAHASAPLRNANTF